MKSLPIGISISLACAIALLSAGITFADDSAMFRRDVSDTPEMETEHAAIRMLPLYVPAQNTSDELVTIEYTNYDGGVLADTRDYARPLISHYTDGHVDFIEVDGYGGFPGHGHRDAYGAVSLDDGATWKKTNLSKSGDQSSIRIKLGGRQKIDYPGDVGRTFAASDGNKVLIVWVSRYARGGNPNYAMSDDERLAVATYLETQGTIESAVDCTDYFTDEGTVNSDDSALTDTPCLYLEDIFGVAGSQGISDLADEEYPLIGELPYAAVWAARGVLLPPAAEGATSSFVWFKAERLSSAVRDANRPEAVCVKGAGCVVTWQEDPDGIRPGHGDGPGEGWSGAIAHHQTDTWYSYIDWDDFGLVVGDGDDDGYGTFYASEGTTNTDGAPNLADWVADNDTGSPQAAIPMAIPVRLTDNAMCVPETDTEADKPYCYADFNGNGIADFCATNVAVEITTPAEETTSTQYMCVTEDGRLLRGTTASTRARLGLHGYSSLGDYSADPVAYPIDSAWFYMAYEENKGLGDICDDGDCLEVEDADKRDMGKNVWYHTFDMFNPELVSQGLMLNQPAVYPSGEAGGDLYNETYAEWTDPSGLLEKITLSGYNFYAFKVDPIYEEQAGITTATLLQTEISRRPSKISQDWYDAGESGLVGLQLWKQGIVRRGGPADIFGRRFVKPSGVSTPDTYEVCTTTEECTTTYSWVVTTSFPVVENPDYDFNKGLCKKDDPPPRCYEFVCTDPATGDSTYTNDPESCSIETWFLDQENPPTDPEQEYTTSESCDTVTECVEDSEGVCPDDPNGDLTEDQFCKPIPGSGGGFDETADNPYDYANMECLDADDNSAWHFTDGLNPRYVKGLCAAPAINLSATTIQAGVECTDALNCFEVFPFGSYFDDLVMADDPVTKIKTWLQFGADSNGGFVALDLDTEGLDQLPPADQTNLNDMSWENPYDVAKGHRGFIAGDMVMVMYAAAPNWKALTDAHETFNLYNRRSFDGGKTWTTLPTEFTHAASDEPYVGEGTYTCEFMVLGTDLTLEEPVCTTYGAGAFEQARNVSQLTGSNVTVLDPRFAPTTRSITEASVTTVSLPAGFFAPAELAPDGYEDDTRDPSRYFMVYETGHASAYDAGEAEPLDLFYSRAIKWGDQYLVWQDEDAYEGECYPSADPDDDNDYGDGEFCNEFDALEGKNYLESGEAAVAASPGGRFFYAIWNQGKLDGEEVVESDAIFRRVLFLDEYEPTLEEPTP